MKIFLTLFVLLFSSNVYSLEKNLKQLFEDILSENENEEFIPYAMNPRLKKVHQYHKESVRYIGDIVEFYDMWFEFNNIMLEPFTGMTSEINCKTYEFRIIGRIVMYDRFGNLVHEMSSEEHRKWRRFVVGSAYDSLHKVLC